MCQRRSILTTSWRVATSTCTMTQYFLQNMVSQRGKNQLYNSLSALDVVFLPLSLFSQGCSQEYAKQAN